MTKYFDFCEGCTCCQERLSEHLHCAGDVRMFHCGESHAVGVKSND